MSALEKMLEQLGTKRHGGYVTRLPEAKEILSELSEFVSVGIRKEETLDPDMVEIKLTIGFTLSRRELHGPVLPTEASTLFTACEHGSGDRTTFTTLVGHTEPVYMAEGDVCSVYTRDELLRQFYDFEIGVTR